MLPSTFLAISAPLHVAAAVFPSLLRALLTVDLPASLSLRVSNEEVIAELGLTAHALLVGHFPSSGKWSMEAILFVIAEAAAQRCLCALGTLHSPMRVGPVDAAGAGPGWWGRALLTLLPGVYAAGCDGWARWRGPSLTLTSAPARHVEPQSYLSNSFPSPSV